MDQKVKCDQMLQGLYERLNFKSNVLVHFK